MNSNELSESLTRFSVQLSAITIGLTSEQVKWKPESGAWSILEIVAHLADEEEYDFPLRLELTLKNPKDAWPPIDPEGWAVKRRYQEKDFEEVLNRFLDLRKSRLQWLAELENPNWESTYVHPEYGDIKAGDLFAAWAAHDLLHLRQITKRLFEQVNLAAGDFGTRYAGDW